MYLKTKLIADKILSLVLILILLPLMIIIALLVLLGSGWPIIFSQERVGYHGKKFKIYKFRTMRHDAEKNGPKLTASITDPRFTKIGRGLSRYYLNELPQFFNVLKGDMCLIGPRPEREYYHKKFCRLYKGWEKRLEVPQGIIGLAQTNSATSLTPKRKLALDLKYIKKFSFREDAAIIFKAVALGSDRIASIILGKS